MASSHSKKRKYEEGNGSFKTEWVEDFAFTINICALTVMHRSLTLEPVSTKRSKKTVHLNILLKSELQKNKLTELMFCLNSQQGT